MPIVSAPGGPKILVTAAHPDDIEATCAGTLMLAIAQGARVRLLLATSGDKGSSDPAIDPLALAAQRESEAQNAASILGIEAVEFLRYPDGELENTRELRGHIVRAIREWQPDVVFTFDPEHALPPYLSHRDHRVIGRATLDAVYPLSRDHLSFPELISKTLTPHKVAEVWLYYSGIADSWVDISSVMDRKIDARLAHACQTPDPALLRTAWFERARIAGEAGGLPMAEAFTIIQALA